MTDTQQQSSININNLTALVNGINLAQKRGTFSLEESAALLTPVKTVVAFINSIKNLEATKSENNETESANQDNNINI